MKFCTIQRGQNKFLHAENLYLFVYIDAYHLQRSNSGELYVLFAAIALCDDSVC